MAYFLSEDRESEIGNSMAGILDLVDEDKVVVGQGFVHILTALIGLFRLGVWISGLA